MKGFSNRTSNNIKDNIIYSKDKNIKVLGNILLDIVIFSTNLNIIVLVNKKNKSK